MPAVVFCMFSVTFPEQDSWTKPTLTVLLATALGIT
jgi:hypothetical protein